MEKIKIDKQQRKNLFAAIKNFNDIARNFYICCRENIIKNQELNFAFLTIEDLSLDYGTFYRKLNNKVFMQDKCTFYNIKLHIENICLFCKKSGLFQNLLQPLDEAKDICLSVLENKIITDIEIKDKEWVKRRKRFYGFMFLICIFALVTSSILCIVIVNDFQRYKTEEVSIVFTIQNVNLVQYSNRNYLTAYTYLKAPNGREISIKETSSSRELYEVAKNHIGQDIELLVKEKYYLNKNGEKENIEHKIKFPIQILKIEGEDVEYVENISNVEVQRRLVVVPYLK